MGQGFTRADELTVGQLIATHTQQPVEVLEVDLSPLELVAYNYTVEDYKTYFVGEFGLWVHNACDITRNAAFREAKEKGGIPRSQQPDRVYHERIRDQNDNYVEGRVYEFSRPDGSTVTIREHSLGHVDGNHGPHFNTELRSATTGTRQPLSGNGDSHTYFNGPR